MKNYKLLLTIVLFLPLTVFSETNSKTLDLLYKESQANFNKGDFKKALPLLEKYFNQSKGKKIKQNRLFWVTDQIGRIHLRVNKNPEQAINFFEKALKGNRLGDGQEDDVRAWIVAAKDWKESKLTYTASYIGTKQFNMGKKFYLKGKKINKYPADDAGNAYFSLAKSHLVPFIFSNDKSARISEALFMMGEIRLHLRTDSEYWNENFYLKEVIRRFPNTKVASKAYDLLEDDIKFGFSGSSGEHIPTSLKVMLRNYRTLSLYNKKVLKQ